MCIGRERKEKNNHNEMWKEKVRGTTWQFIQSVAWLTALVTLSGEWGSKWMVLHQL
jgi:cytochrome c oxidase assembly factor CtaG